MEEDSPRRSESGSKMWEMMTRRTTIQMKMKHQSNQKDQAATSRMCLSQFSNSDFFTVKPHPSARSRTRSGRSYYQANLNISLYGRKYFGMTPTRSMCAASGRTSALNPAYGSECHLGLELAILIKA